MLRSTAQSDRPIYKIASIPADGIGPGVISAGIEVLRTLAWVLGDFHLSSINWNGTVKTITKHGTCIPEDGIDTLKSTMRFC